MKSIFTGRILAEMGGAGGPPVSMYGSWLGTYSGILWLGSFASDVIRMLVSQYAILSEREDSVISKESDELWVNRKI